MISHNMFGVRAKFHHVGIAVKSIKSVNSTVDIITDPIQKVRVAFIAINGIKTELIEPLCKESPITNSIEKNIKLVHLCYVVADLQETMEKCRIHGFHCFKPAVPAVAFDDKNIAWVYSKDYGLVELLEDPGRF